MKVAKFGGTSLANAEQIRKVCDIAVSDPERRLIVVSAPGKRFKEDTKVTDLLINLANKFISDKKADIEYEAVIERFREIAGDLSLSDEIVTMISADISERLSSYNGNNDKFTDSLKAAGEDNCAKLVACYLKSIGYNASYINPNAAGMILSGEYGNARILPESYVKLSLLKNNDGIMIFPGFFGYSETGDVVTFPRGGSDITGSILAAAVDAELYENFTDVDSVFAANPNLIENPKAIPVFTYREMRELSYAGFSVLHEETLEPVYRKGIPVCIKNTNNPKTPGTMIVPRRESSGGFVVGIASGTGFCSIYISKYMMNREIGFGRKVLHILEDESISYEHIPSGIDNISILVNEKTLSKEREERVINRIKSELNVDDIFVERNKALVMVVGEGMSHTVGLAAKATGALTRAGINIEMINQGSSEVSMIFGVDASSNVAAVKALYSEFFG